MMSLTQVLASGAWHRVRYVYDPDYGLKDVFVGLRSVLWQKGEQDPVAGTVLYLERYQSDWYPETWDPGEFRLSTYGLEIKGAWHRQPGAPGVTIVLPPSDALVAASIDLCNAIEPHITGRLRV